MNTNRDQNTLLGKLYVLDLADEKAGFCSKLLADMGARVVKIEQPGGDRSRRIGPFLKDSPHPEGSLSFLYNNTNKLGITLNLAHSEGKRLFFHLVERTDVIVETFPPGYMERLGLGYEVLSHRRPGLILTSVTGFGRNGPRKDFASCDLVASAYGGQMYVTGSENEAPLKIYGEQSYVTASLFAAIGILLALRKRGQFGTGEHIDISLQEAVASTLDHVMVRYFYEQMIPKRGGSLHWNHLFCMMPCKDGFIRMTINWQWETLVEWLENEGMADDLIDEKWKDEAYRRDNVDHIIEVLGRWTKTHSVDELFESGQLMNFPWAPVRSPEEIVASPQLNARGFFTNSDHAETGDRMRYPGLPFQFSPPFEVPRKRAPSVGEDNVSIYHGELGISKEELKRLYDMGAI